MDKKMSIKELAQLAGVGVGTVSRVLNDSPGVKASTRDRVKALMEEIGYKPDEMARTLRTGRTRTVLVFISDISNPSFSPIAKGIQHVLDEQGYRFVLYDTGESNVDEKVFEALRGTPADGAVICVSSEELPKTAKYIRKSGLPLLTIDREPSNYSASRIHTDYYEGFRHAVEYLHELGHERIALICGNQAIRPARESVRGFIDAYTELMEGQEPLLASGPYDAAFSSRVMEQWMALPGRARPTAVIVSNYAAAIGVLEWSRNRNIQFPDDLSLIAFEDMELFRFFRPGITSISRPLYELGKQAGRMMVEAITAGRVRSEIRVDAVCTIPTQLVRRESCGPAPVMQQD